MRTGIRFAFLLTGLLAAGCKEFEYRIVQPPQFAQVIPKDKTLIVPYDPLEYRISRQDDYLVLQLSNPTSDPIRLAENRSYLITPQGETHPVRGQFIGPHSFIRMTLPGLPPSLNVYGYTPFYGGFYANRFYPGYGSFPYYSYYYAPYGPPFYMPYTYSYQMVTPYNWAWEAGDARLHLGFDRAGKEFDHEFLFTKQRVH